MKYQHKKVNLKALAAGFGVDAQVQLPAGECIGMGAISTGAGPNQFVDLSVLDNGSEIVEGSEYRFFEKTNGGRWIDGLRPMSFTCNRNVVVRLSTETALAADLNVQVIFVIAQPS